MKLTLQEYLALVWGKQLYFKRSWRLAALMRLIDYTPEAELYPFSKDGKFYTIHNGEEYLIEGRNGKSAFIKWSERITIPKGIIVTVDKDIESTIGRLIVNTLAFTSEFGDLIPYINDSIDTGTIKKAYGKLYSDGKIKTAKQLVTSMKYVHLLESDAEFGVPAASMETFTISKEVLKRRDELYKEYEGRLNDPVVQAKIDSELIALDKASHKGTQAEDFLGGKAYNVVRKKTKIHYGSETGMDGRPTGMVTRPLSESLSVEDMPSWVNIARAGSYARGQETAKGGFGVKQDERAYGHLEIEMGKDCKTKLGVTLEVTEVNYKVYAGTRLLKDNKILTAVDLESLIGKTITIRMPSHCKLPGMHPCEFCMGDTVKKGKYTIPGNVSQIDSNTMYAFMAAGHGKSKELNYISIEMLR